MTNLDILNIPQVNKVFPTDGNLNITVARFKAAMPIENMNDLLPLLMIYQNTLITTLESSK